MKLQITGDIYIHDFYMFIEPYCFAYSCLDIVEKGLPMIGKIKSLPPKNLFAFKSQIEQFVTIASNSTVGACGLADLLLVMSYYVKKIIDTKMDSHFKFQTEEDCWAYVKETLISMIYTLNQPMRGDQCVTEDTEVLTPDGFKTYNELKINDDIYTWSNGILNVQKVQRVNISNYEGIMHQYEGRDLNQVVTPNHKVLYKKFNSNEYSLEESNSIFNQLTPTRIPIAMKDNLTKDYNISDDWLKLVTFILTDGCIDYRNKELQTGGRVSFFKSNSRYGIQDFKDTCDYLGLEYYEYVKTGGFDTEVNHYRFTIESSKYILELLEGTKKSLPSWFTKLSKRQAIIVIDLWAKLDGHTDINKYNSQKLQCDNYNIANSIQHLCFLACKGSRITERLIGCNKTATIYVIPYNRQIKCATNKKEVKYSGKIWCPTTDDGIVVYRKDGKIFISGNSPFTNVSIYDKYFLEESKKLYIFPGNILPDDDIINKLQDVFLTAMNEELNRTVFTFPVVTACFCIDDDGNIKDEKFLKFIAKHDKKFGFINMFTGYSSVLSACCRLKSDKNNIYLNSIGGSSNKIGSLGVCTINLPRLGFKYKNDEDGFYNELKKIVEVTGKINNCKRHLIRQKIDEGFMPLYSLGFINLNSQYSTTGINGMYECLKYRGHDILTDEGQQDAIKMMDTINDVISGLERQYTAPHNVEQVPAEGAASKLAKKDKLLGFNNEYELYSNQFIPLIANADLLDRIKIQGLLDDKFSGGSILHVNVDTEVDENKICQLIKTCAKMGVRYFGINYQLNECENGHISNGRIKRCSICNGNIVDSFHRVVGYIVSTKNFSKVRREYEYPERKWYKDIV